VHYSEKGTEKTAEEIDYIGKDGLRGVEGTVTHIDRGARILAIKTEEGPEETFHLTEHAATALWKDMAGKAQPSGKVKVFYSEDSGGKTAHFFGSPAVCTNDSESGGFDFQECYQRVFGEIQPSTTRQAD